MQSTVSWIESLLCSINFQSANGKIFPLNHFPSKFSEFAPPTPIFQSPWDKKGRKENIETKADTLKFCSFSGGEWMMIGVGARETGKLENLVCAIRKSPSLLKYHLTHCFGEKNDGKTKPNSNILNDFYDFCLLLHLSLSLPPPVRSSFTLL